MCAAKVTERARPLMMAVLRREVACLVKRDAFRSLEDTMSCTGYINNLSSQSSASLGSAIVALGKVIELSDLAVVIETAVHQRHLLFRGRKSPESASRGILAKCGVILDVSEDDGIRLLPVPKVA